MVYIQYSSDLHIDKFPKGTSFYSFLTPTAPILILAGDICPATNPLFRAFLGWCSRHWHTVLFTAGNHEYYCREQTIRTHAEIDALIRNITARFGNVVYLQDGGRYTIPNTNITVLGSTLWSDVDVNIHDAVRAKKGEYKYIYKSVADICQNVIPADISAFHTIHKRALKTAIANTSYNQQIIVVSHHLPTHRLLEPEYRQEAWRSCYASADEDIFSKRIHTWICGHGHRGTMLRYKKMMLRMNARGYNKPSELNRKIDIYKPAKRFFIHNAFPTTVHKQSSLVR